MKRNLDVLDCLSLGNEAAVFIEGVQAYAYSSGSIRQIATRLQEEGYPVSENALRSWVKNGYLPAAYCGKKAYLVYENVIDLLKRGTPKKANEPRAVGIRKIN